MYKQLLDESVTEESKTDSIIQIKLLTQVDIRKSHLSSIKKNSLLLCGVEFGNFITEYEPNLISMECIVFHIKAYGGRSVNSAIKMAKSLHKWFLGGGYNHETSQEHPVLWRSINLDGNDDFKWTRKILVQRTKIIKKLC